MRSELHEIKKVPINQSVIIYLHGCDALVFAEASTSHFTLHLIHPDSSLPRSKWLWLMADCHTNNHVVFSLQVFCIMKTSPGLSLKRRPGPWRTLLTKLSMQSPRTPQSLWRVAFAGTRLVIFSQCWCGGWNRTLPAFVLILNGNVKALKKSQEVCISPMWLLLIAIA